jgi:hypothetical protein
MNIKRTTDSIISLLTIYQQFLNKIDDDIFDQTPALNVWSYSEVYAHVIRANFSSLVAIEKCIHNRTSASGKITVLGRLVLFFGKFPPVKIKVPESVAKQVVKISREEARNELVRLKQKIEVVIPKLQKCSNSQRILHPRLGMLDACQWLRFIEIHTKHHLKQLKRIGAMLIKA